MSNKLTAILSTIIFSLCFSSCSIYEDIYFKDNQTVRYEMKLDASEVLSMMPDLANKADSSIPSDSIISIAEVVKEKIDTTNMTDSDKIDLQNVSSLFLRVENKPEEHILSFLLYGDFDNVNKLNEALISVDKLQSKTKDSSVDNSGLNLDKISSLSNYLWDGKTMIRTVNVTPNDGVKAENNITSQLFSQGKLVVKYHFTQKVQEISDPNALLSQDGKTVIIEYPASVFQNPDDKMNIEIITE